MAVKKNEFDPQTVRDHSGWFAVLENGDILKEGKSTWQDVIDVMEKVCVVGLVCDGRIHSLPPGKENYWLLPSTPS